MASSSVSQEEQEAILSHNSVLKNPHKTRLRGSGRIRSTTTPAISENPTPDNSTAQGISQMNISGSLPEKCSGGPEVWRNSAREKGVRQPPPVEVPSSCPTVRNKLRDRRRLREKRRSPGSNYVQSTEGTSTGDEECDVFAGNKEPKSPGFIVGSDDQQQAPSHHQHFHNHANSGSRSNQHEHPLINRRLSPAVGLANHKFRVSKSQSDLEADCEDNTADYDSASMISASETSGGQSQFFIPDPSVADRDFQAHVQEIRVAGMQQLTASGGPQTEEEGTGTSSDDMEEDLGKILEKERREKSTLMHEMGQQEERIHHLETVVNELTTRLQDTCLENQNLRAENISLKRN